MTFVTRDVHGRPVEADRDHGHVTIRVGDITAEFEPTLTEALRRALRSAQTAALDQRCDDCAEVQR